VQVFFTAKEGERMKRRAKNQTQAEQETEFANMEMDRIFNAGEESNHFKVDVYHISNTAPMIEADEPEK
jgi:cytidylate kinase